MTECKPKRVPRPRRVVTDDEYRAAYHGVRGDPESMRAAANNRGIIRGVLRVYSGRLSEDELDSCGCKALWRCLQYHSDDYGQKFTTSLHRFAHWECQRELRSLRGSKNKPAEWANSKFDDAPDEAGIIRAGREAVAQYANECLDLLPHDWQRVVIRQYYIEGMTMEEVGSANGYSKETARQRLRRALDALRDVCEYEAGSGV